MPPASRPDPAVGATRPGALRMGDVVGDRFAVERFVGAGGMGAVYRAWDRSAGAPVALKVLLGATDPNDKARLDREAQALSELDHPGIVRYVAHGISADERPYLAMEWIEGDDLAKRLHRGPLPVNDAL